MLVLVEEVVVEIVEAKLVDVEVSVTEGGTLALGDEGNGFDIGEY